MLDVALRVEDRGLDVAFVVPHGRRLALLGPNGAGKSSVLAVLAGTLVPDEGHVRLDGTTFVDLGRGRRCWVPAHRRRVGLLAQDPLLFPRLSVLENVAFGPRSRGLGRRAARRLAQEHLERVGAAHLQGRRPDALSGGQAQRVAVARVLASDPALLLLDEPLRAVDLEARPALSSLLADAAAERPTVVVTHDEAEAAVLADHVVCLDGGRVGAAGPADELLEPTRSSTGQAPAVGRGQR